MICKALILVKAKTLIDGAEIGCEPACASTLAEIRKLVNERTLLYSE